MLYNILVFALFIVGCIADKAGHDARQTTYNDENAPRLANESVTDIHRAKALVAAAKLKSSELNKARVATCNPSGNQYKLNPNTEFTKRQAECSADAPPLLNIKASASFVGLGVISTNHYVPNGGTGSDGNAKEWFINTRTPEQSSFVGDDGQGNP